MRVRAARRELRADSALLGCLAAVITLSTLMVSAGPALVARLDDKALRQNVTTAAERGRGVTVTLSTVGLDPSAGFAAFVGQLLAPLPTWARPMLGTPAIDLATPFTDATAPGITTTGGVPPEMRVEYANPVPGGLRYVEGGAPPDGPLAAGVPAPIAASAATRDALHLTLGQVITLGPSGSTAGADSGAASVTSTGATTGASTAGTPLPPKPATARARIVGFFEPLDTTSAATTTFWYTHPWLRAPVSGQGPAVNGFSPLIQRATVLTSVPGLASVLPALVAAGPVTSTIAFPLDPVALTADRAAAFSAQLGRMTDPAFEDPCAPAPRGLPRQCGPFTVTRSGLVVAADIKPTLDRFVAARAEVWVVDSFSLASLATVALITLFSAARLAVGRRARDLALHRARGATVRDLMTVRAVHGAVVTVPAALVGWLAARLVLLIGRHPVQSKGPGAAWLLAAIVIAGLVLLPALMWARSRSRPAFVDRAVARRRRLAFEGGLGILAVAAVLSLHSRGIDGPRTAGVDPQISLVPALLGAVGAVLLLRIHPVLLGACLRWARRRRSAVPVLAFAQARRSVGLGAAGLLVLVLTLAGLVFGGLVTRTVTGAHSDVAESVSGDAVIAGRGLAPAVRTDVAAVAGVQHVIAEQSLWLTPDAPAGQPASAPIRTVAVDVKALTAADPSSPLARLLAGSGQPAYASAAVPHHAAGPPHPADSAAATGLSVNTPTGSTTLDLSAVGTLSATDLRVIATDLDGLTPSDPFLVVPLTVAAKLTPGADPDTLVIDGPGVAESELRAALPANIDYQIQTRADLAGSLDASTLTDSLDLVANACAAVASGFALLAVVLELLAGARARGDAVSFLRTMGLRSRAATGMLIVQLLPPACLAALAGVCLGVLIPPVLGSALRLQAVTGGAAEPVLRVDFATAAALGAGMVALVLLAALIDSRLARRRKLGSVLRFDAR